MSQSPNDKQELVADLQAIPAQAGSIEVVLIDSGFYSESAVARWNKPPRAKSSAPSSMRRSDARAITAVSRSVADLEKNEEPSAPAPRFFSNETSKRVYR